MLRNQLFAAARRAVSAVPTKHRVALAARFGALPLVRTGFTGTAPTRLVQSRFMQSSTPEQDELAQGPYVKHDEPFGSERAEEDQIREEMKLLPDPSDLFPSMKRSDFFKTHTVTTRNMAEIDSKFFEGKTSRSVADHVALLAWFVVQPRNIHLDTTLPRRAMQELANHKEFDTQEVYDLVRLMHQTGRQFDMLQRLCDEVQQSASSFTTSQLSDIFYCFAELGVRNFDCIQELHQQLVAMQGEIPFEDMSRVVSSIVRLGISESPLVAKSLELLKANIHDCSVRDLMPLLFAYANLYAITPSDLAVVSNRAAELASDMQPIELHMVILALAKLQSTDANAYANLALYSAKRNKRFDPAHIAEIVLILAQTGAGANASYHTLTQAAIRHVNDYPANTLKFLMQAYQARPFPNQTIIKQRIDFIEDRGHGIG